MNRLSKIFVYILAMAFIVALTFFLIASCLRNGACVVETGASGLSPIDAFGYAGALVTVMAFVAAFAIVLMTIDALHISSTVHQNARQVGDNQERLKEIEKGLTASEDSLVKIRSFLTVLEVFVEEIDRSSDQEDDLYFAFEVLQEKVQLENGVREKLLKGRESLGRRRARLNAIRSVVSKMYGEDVSAVVARVFPELVAASQDGDAPSKQALMLLDSNELLDKTQSELVRRLA